MSKKINKITVVGGGSAGWMSAASLIKAFPKKEIVVIEPKNIPIIGVGESTLGGIRDWTKFIDIDETEFFNQTDASLKMSIKFTDFYKKDAGHFHYPFGRHDEIELNNYPGLSNAKHIWHIKKFFYPKTPVQDFVRCLFPQSFLFENNKFDFDFKKYSPFNIDKDVAYHFDATKFGQWLKNNYCIPKGVKLISSEITNAKVSEEGIDFVVLENGEKIYSDLFVDCTGFKSLLLGQYLKEEFKSYEDLLPNNRAWATRIQYKDKEKEIEPFTNSTAIENGWCWNIPLWSRLGSGYVYSDKFVDPEEAKKQFKNYLMSEKMVIPRNKEEVNELEYKDIKMRIGIHKKTFVKNVVAIGLSAGFIEPLESNGLLTVHEFIFKLIDILQRDSINQFDRDMYNSETFIFYHGFAKFVALHYALSHRNDSDYWKNIQNKSFSDEFGDPYFPYFGRASTFSDLARNYMDEWLYPKNNSGVPYIATGMNLFTMNERRIQYMESVFKKDLKIILGPVWNKWEQDKLKFSEFAKNAPTLYEFLKNNFYKT